MTKINQNAFFVTVAGIDLGMWSQKTGGVVSVDIEDDYDGGALKPTKMKGRRKYTPVVLSRTYDPARDTAALKAVLAQLDGVDEFPITVQPTKPGLDGPQGDPWVYTGVVAELTLPDVDSNSSSRATVSLQFDVTELV